MLVAVRRYGSSGSIADEFVILDTSDGEVGIVPYDIIYRYYIPVGNLVRSDSFRGGYRMLSGYSRKYLRDVDATQYIHYEEDYLCVGRQKIKIKETDDGVVINNRLEFLNYFGDLSYPVLYGDCIVLRFCDNGFWRTAMIDNRGTVIAKWSYDKEDATNKALAVKVDLTLKV